MEVIKIKQYIFVLRGQKVMLDIHLADLYNVETKALVQAVKRNADRFPDDFMFQLNQKEFNQLTTPSTIQETRGGRRYFPYAFTEQGIAMLSSVLRSKSAIQVNIEIMRSFIKLRKILASNDNLNKKVEALELKYDEQFSCVFKLIRRLINEDNKSKNNRNIGFADWNREKN
jgi:hypothetical protein